MPEVFFGIWQKLRSDEVLELIKQALFSGFRGIDTAYRYQIDADIGVALDEVYRLRPKLKRHHLYITGKCWVTYNNNVSFCLEKSLNNLKIDYFDLYRVVLD